MGVLVSTWNGVDRARSDAIDRSILEESRKYRKVNVLLLGTDSKIHMIVKQIKIHHGLTDDERKHHRLAISDDILCNAQTLVRAIHDMGFEYSDHINHVNADRILDYRIRHNPSSGLSPEIAEAIHCLWQDPILPKVMVRRSEFWPRENVEYFFGEILRIGSPGYLPTDNDILRAQRNFSRFMQARLTFGTLQLTIIECPRQLSPKRLHYVEDTPYVCFCASLSDYDQVLQENCHKNRLSESLVYFECLVNSRWFLRSSIILFLTDVDEFKDKLSEVPLERYLPTYDGGANVDRAIKHIQTRFMQVNNQAKRPIHVIEHRAVDTTIDALLQIIKDTEGVPGDAKDSHRVPSCSAAELAVHLRRMLPPTRPLKPRLWGTF